MSERGNQDTAMDEGAMERQNRRYIELASMFKEFKTGGVHLKEKIMAKFCLQEGVSKKKAHAYYNLLVSSGLIKFRNGHKSWKYDPTEEWECFRVEI